MNGKYILALDQGTTSSRVILFDRDQNILGVSQIGRASCRERVSHQV